jgi:hypothetical protein
MTISESVMKAAHEGIEAQPLISDIEKAARAIVVRLGGDPDALRYLGMPLAIGRVNVAPRVTAPLWTFFTQEAEAALNAVHK